MERTKRWLSFRAIWVLARKEVAAVFYSPIGYVVSVVFLLVVGWFFMSTFYIRGIASMVDFFRLLPYVLCFVVPAYTMRSFSEEFNTGSFELLASYPVRLIEVILGKLVANGIFVALLLIPTFFYAISISFAGKLDWVVVLASYKGSFLLGLCFVSIGLFSSAVTKNQIIAWIVGAALCFLLVMIDSLLFFLPSSLLTFVRQLSIESHFDKMSKGVIDLRDLLYFLSVIYVFVYMTYLSIEKKMR